MIPCYVDIPTSGVFKNGVHCAGDKEEQAGGGDGTRHHHENRLDFQSLDP